MKSYSDPLESSSSPARPERWQGALAGGLLAAVTLLVLGQVIGHQFTWWDDQRTIHHNAQFNPPTREGIAQTWKKPAYGLYVPLTYSYWGALAYAAEKPADELGIHLDPRVYHTGSLALHMAAVLVVFAILRMLTGRVWPSMAGALLFAIHPVQVEPVAWASGAKDLLAGLLSLCAIHQYVLFAGERPEGECAEAAGPSKWRRRAYYGTGMVLLVLAMLAKPSAVVVPVIVAAIDGLLLRRDWLRAVLSAGGWGLAILPLTVIASLVQTGEGVVSVAWWQKPLIAGDALAFYLGKLVWPVNLAPDYGRRPAVVLAMWGGAWVYVAWIIPAVVGFLAWRWRARVPQVACGALLLLAGVIPVLGLVPFMFQYMSTVADHYLYLAMLGPALALAGAAGRIARARQRRIESGSTRQRLVRWAPTVTCGLIVAAALGLRSRSQLTVWHDDVSLWRHTMAACPDSFVAPNNIAANLGRESALLEELARDAEGRGDRGLAQRLSDRRRQVLREAVALLEQSVRINPQYQTARHNAALNYMRLGEHRMAVAHLEELLKNNAVVAEHQRDDEPAYRAMVARLYMRLGRYDLAAAHFDRVLKVVPDHPTVPRELEDVRAKLAEARVE